MLRFTWGGAKRLANLRKHGIDFKELPPVFDGLTLTYEDLRYEYRERRFITVGLLRDTVVLVAHTESANTIRIIHARKASQKTARRYFAQSGD